MSDPIHLCACGNLALPGRYSCSRACANLRAKLVRARHDLTHPPTLHPTYVKPVPVVGPGETYRDSRHTDVGGEFFWAREARKGAAQ